MRVLVAGRSAKALAQAAGAFAGDLTMATATTKAAAFALLDHTEFDLVVACETLGDGSGLEVLSQVAVNAPNTLRIFAARPATLALLKGELGLFGLFRTLPYPISFRKLWAAIDLARGSRADGEAGGTVKGIRGTPQAPHVRHVVLEADWETTQPLPVLDAGGQGDVRPSPAPTAVARNSMGAPPAVAARNPARNPPQPASSATTRAQQASRAKAAAKPAPSNAAPTKATRASAAPTNAARTNAKPATAVPTNTTPRSHPPPTNRAPPQDRIPETEAFKRAVARRKDGKARQEPSVTNESLAQLAHVSLKRRSTYDGRTMPGGRKRTVLFVGSGVFAAVAAAVLTFFMLGSNNSIGRSALPIVASIDRALSQNVLPWQASQSSPPAEPTPTTFVPNETVTPAAADMEVEGEAASEQLGVEPGHPGPPPPNPPPGPSEPPQYDASGVPVEE
jgi:hypothetical protein